MTKTARERLARLFAGAEPAGSFSAQLLAPAQVLELEVSVGRAGPASSSCAVDEEADRGGPSGDVRPGRTDPDRHGRA